MFSLSGEIQQTQSSFETDPQVLKELAISASFRALRESMASNLPQVYLEEGKILREFPDGLREVLLTL
jgi:hypothetical protein